MTSAIDGGPMNLYDLIGPVAIGVGVGASYGAAHTHGIEFWLSVLLGVGAGFGTFLALRRRLLPDTSERKLAAYYVATPICVVMVTMAVSWGARAII
jgi:hypothetical protein